jgi:8-oxo-dGTP pyrophosphatase MutT (NUDIX family)
MNYNLNENEIDNTNSNNINTNNINNNNNINNVNNQNNDFYKNNETPYCINCGKKGHIFKKCLFPIISLGVICINIHNYKINLNEILNYSKKIQNNYLFSLEEINKLKILKKNILNLNLKNFDKDIKYLMIRRKHSLNYIEFIRGKYDFNNIEYLENIINLMSVHEKNKILNSDFNSLWKELWNESKKNSNEYRDSEYKFNLLKNGTLIKKNDINFKTSLEYLIKNSFIHFEEPEWGFPKGRRNAKEKNIDCARREFEEETNLKNDDYIILNMSPLEETYLSTNSSKYKHIYYIGQTKNNIDLILDANNIHMNTEIGDIGWYCIDEALLKIRDYNIDKKSKLLYLHKMIKNTLENFMNILNDFLQFL